MGALGIQRKMQSTAPSPRLNTIWDQCCQAYAANGIRLRFPAGTDRQKTYLWRYLNKLASRLDRWGLDNKTSARFIQIAVAHAKHRRLLHKGLAALVQNNLLEICHAKMAKDDIQFSHRLEALSNSVSYLNYNQDKLLQRPHPDAPPNIVTWYRGGFLSSECLVMSKRCWAAMLTLPEADRKLLPRSVVTMLACSDYWEDADTKQQIVGILGDDWRPECQLQR